MEVVQTVGPLACAPSHGAPPATHSRLRIDGDRSLHVQTEEGGGGLDPSWWKISASGSWDGGERRMRYGKLIDDGPGGIPGAVQRRKLEMLETHAPGASMRVVHSQSTSSWVQDPSNSNSSELNSGISNSRRSILSSSSSSTRVTSFRQWSSNFSQNSNSTLGIKSDTRPASADFGNLELVLNPLDVSSLRTRGNVGRSGSIGARRPPSRGRRFSASLTGDESPIADEGGSHDSGKEKELKKEDSASPNAGKSWTAVVVSLNSGESSLRQRRIPAKTTIHRKRSVSSEDVRDGEQNSGNNDEGQWMRGAAVRRSLPSSEWRSVLVGTSDNKGPRRISPVPSGKYGSFVTAESLREMKGKLKHHGSTEIREDTRDLSTSDVNRETAACLGGSDSKTSSVEEDGSESKGHQEDRRRSWSVGCGSQGQEDEGSASRRRSYAFEFSAEERGESPETRGRSQEKRGDLQRGKLRVESQPYHLEAVNQVLKRWSALSNDDEDSKTQNTSSTVIRSTFEDIRQDSPVKNSSIWLDRSRDKEEPHSSTTSINGRTTTTLRVLQPNEDVSSELPTHEKSLESSFTISTDNMDDYMSSHGLAPIEWTESDFKSVKEEMPNASAGISVTFSNAEGGEGPRHRYSVTHLESREGEKTDMQGNKNRTSKKVEFSKTEVHFAAESGRFHIVETAGKPPPSNNFRRRRRSPTGLDVGVKSVVLQPVATDGMRFGDSPYEIRLLTGSDSSVEHSSRTNEDYIVDELPNSDDQPTEMDNSQENKLGGKSTMFGELSTEQERESEDFQKLSEDTETSVSSSTVLFGFDEQSPRSILRSSAPPWKSSAQSDHVDDDDSKPKFGGVRLRPVVSPMHHSRVNVTKVEPTDPMVSSTNEDKTYFSSLSPGHMELQKLLRSLRHVSVTYSDSQLSEPSTTAPNVANGGGMEVRICSVGNPSGVSNTIIIGNEATANESTPMSVAQRVREVEERRRKELSERQSNVLKPSPSRGGGQFSTRVTLGSPVISLETKVPKETLQTERTQPLSPKPMAKLSVPDNKITRIHNTQDKVVQQLHVVRKGIREEIRGQTTRYRTTSEDSPLTPLLGGRDLYAPSRLEQSLLLHRCEERKKTMGSEGLWKENAAPSASWPLARGFGRIGEDRVILKSPSLILQTMLSVAFSSGDKEEVSSTAVEIHEKKETKVVEKVEEKGTKKGSDNEKDDFISSGDRLQPKLSILRALYRAADEDEGSDAAGNGGMMSLERSSAGEVRAGDGGSVVSGSWRRLRRSKQQQNSARKQAEESLLPKPAPRRQQAAARIKERAGAVQNDPPKPPPRTRNNAQRVKKRNDGRVGGREMLQERRRGGGGGGGECRGKGVAADSLLQSQVATSSDIKTSRLNENPGKTERAQDMPKVTRIALGFREKATDGMRNADESKMEAEDGSEDSSAFTIDVPKAELPKKLTSKIIEQNYDMRKKSVEESVQSGRGRHSVSSPPRDAGSCWRGNNEAKSKRDEDVIKSDSNPKSVRSQRRNKEISEKSSFATSNSSTVEIERFPQNATNSKSFKGETPSNELAGKFSVKMKVIKKSAEEEKSSGTREHKLQETTKTTSHYDCIRRRNSPNTLTTSSKSTESEPGSNSQRSRKESLSRTDFKSVISQTSKSPMTDRRNRSGLGLNAIGNPEVSSPSSGRVVRKKLRKRSSGGKVSSPSERKRKENIADDESSFLEELTKAADEILNAVNGYSDEGSSDEEPLKNNPRVAPWRSSPSLRPKVSKNQREARVTPSEGVVSREESRRTSRVTGAKPPVVASNSHGGTYTISAEKGQRSKQQPSSRKSMTRIDPTTRVPEVKLIEKRPPLPPPGQRKTAGLKEKSESIGTRGAHGRPKITASLIYNKDGEPERLKETKRPINIARALEAVMPDSGSKTRKMEVKTEAATKISSSSKRDGNASNPSSAPSSPATTSSFERKKVASSRDGDKFSRRRLQQNVASPA